MIRLSTRLRFAHEARVLRRMIAGQLAINLIYRGNFAIMMAAAIVIPMMSLFVWRAALVSGAELPVGENYLTTYFVTVSVVNMATSSWMCRFLAEDIRLGRLSAWMVRPAPLLYHHLANNLAEKLLKGSVLLPLVGVLAIVFSNTIRLPATAERWGLFGLSTLLGGVLVFLVDIMIGALAFWFNDITSLVWARTILANFLSGAVIPLSLMPAWSQGIVTSQPYRFMVSFPVEILSGDLTSPEMAYGFTLQVTYILIACVTARLVWKAGLKVYTAVGA